MKKRFVFLLVMLLVLMGSTLTALAGGTEGTTVPAGAEERVVPDITTPGGITYYAKKYEKLFFNEDKTSEEDFLVTVTASRDLRAIDPLRYLLTGSVNSTDTSVSATAENNVMMLLYIKRDGEYVPLETIDAKLHKDMNLVETPKLVYAKVLLDNLGNEKVNELRIIAFRKSDVDSLKLDENLQITDMKVVARTGTVIDRLRIGVQTIENSVVQLLR